MMKILENKLYTAPEVIKEEDYEIDWEKSDVFSLGLTILEASTLEKIEFLKKLSEIDLIDFIEKNVESEYLKKKLTKMIKFDPNSRISFEKLSEELSFNYFTKKLIIESNYIKPDIMNEEEEMKTIIELLKKNEVKQIACLEIYQRQLDFYLIFKKK